MPLVKLKRKGQGLDFDQLYERAQLIWSIVQDNVDDELKPCIKTHGHTLKNYHSPYETKDQYYVRFGIPSGRGEMKFFLKIYENEIRVTHWQKPLFNLLIPDDIEEDEEFNLYQIIGFQFCQILKLNKQNKLNL